MVCGAMENFPTNASVVDRDRWAVLPAGGLGTARTFFELPVAPELLNTVERDANLHHRMLTASSNGSVGDVYPKYYLRFSKDGRPFPSSSLNSASAVTFYREVEGKLAELEAGPAKEGEFEVGAVATAKLLLRELQTADLPPPELSWHGGDAVVMLWALMHTTYAITITDGEIGYVVRQDKKTIKTRDSIAISNFKVSQLTYHGS